VKNKETILKIGGGVLIIALAVVIYHHAFFNGFVSDDGFQILQNPWIKDYRFLPGIFGHSLSGFSAHSLQKSTYRPMMYAAFTIEHSLFGLNPMGWHLVNIFAHGANGVLVFLLTLRLLRSFTERGEGHEQGHAGIRLSTWLSSFIAAALFISHPAGSEPVSWVSALPELSFTFLTLLVFYLHIHGEKEGVVSGRKKTALCGYAAGPILFFLALLFKETAIVIPFILFIYDNLAKRVQLSKGGGTNYKKIYGGYALAFAAYMVLRTLALGHMGTGSSVNAYLGAGGLLLNAVAGFYRAMVMLFLPMGVYPFQIFHALSSPFEARAVASIIFTTVFVVILFFVRKKIHPLVLLALAIMVLPVLPALYSPVMTRFAIAPRYIYLSTAGYGILLAFIIRWLFRRGPLRGRFYLGGLATALSLVLIILCSVVSANKSLDWRDNLGLARAALRGSADNYYALYQIGNAERGRGRYNEAAKRYGQAIEIIMGKEHKDLQTLRDSLLRLGGTALALERGDEAIGAYERLLMLWPRNATANYQLGYIYQGRGDCEKALPYYAKAFSAFKRSVDKKDTLINMGNCYAKTARYGKAYEAYGKALEISPGDRAARRNIEALQRLMDGR